MAALGTPSWRVDPLGESTTGSSGRLVNLQGRSNVVSSGSACRPPGSVAEEPRSTTVNASRTMEASAKAALESSTICVASEEAAIEVCRDTGSANGSVTLEPSSTPTLRAAVASGLSSASAAVPAATAACPTAGV